MRILPAGRVRHSIRWQGYDYTSAGWYFVTLCAQGRECLFGEVRDGAVFPSESGRLVQSCWEAIPSHFSQAELDAWVLMPNHLHGILAIRRNSQGVGAQHAAPSPPARRPPFVNSGAFLPRSSPLPSNVSPGSLSAIIRSFKSASTREANKVRGTAGVTIWQRNYFEHVIRDDNELERIRAYIQENPSRWEDDQENPAKALKPPTDPFPKA